MFLSLIVRSGVLVGAVYYSQRIGVWGDAEQSSQLYNSIKTQLKPHADALEKKLPFEVPALPERAEVRFLAQHYYNQGVKETFRFIHMLPCYTGQGISKIKNWIEDFSQSPSPPK